MNLIDFTKEFPNEEACERKLKEYRVREGVVCPKCRCVHHYWKNDKKCFECKQCHYRQSLTANTVMHGSQLPLLYWFTAIHLLTSTKKSFSASELQRQLGQKGHADVVQMEADLADRQYDLINTRNQYESEKMTLADLMFWPLDEELEIVTDTSVILREPEATEESIIDYALDHNPAVQIASWQALNAKRELNTSQWQVLPSVGLYAGWSTSYYTYQGSTTAAFADQFRNNGGEYVQVSVSIPIWSRLNKQSTISRKRHALEKASAELDQKRRDVESEVRRAVQDRDGAATAYEQAQHKAEVQAEAYNLNRKKLEQGLISPLEFQTASNNFLRAQADEMNSLFKYLIKNAVVKYYDGVEYINQ